MSMLSVLSKPPLVTPEMIAAKAGAHLTQMERMYIEEVIVMYERIIEGIYEDRRLDDLANDQ